MTTSAWRPGVAHLTSFHVRLGGPNTTYPRPCGQQGCLCGGETADHPIQVFVFDATRDAGPYGALCDACFEDEALRADPRLAGPVPPVDQLTRARHLYAVLEAAATGREQPPTP